MRPTDAPREPGLPHRGCVSNAACQSTRLGLAPVRQIDVPSTAMSSTGGNSENPMRDGGKHLEVVAKPSRREMRHGARDTGLRGRLLSRLEPATKMQCDFPVEPEFRR